MEMSVCVGGGGGGGEERVKIVHQYDGAKHKPRET